MSVSVRPLIEKLLNEKPRPRISLGRPYYDTEATEKLWKQEQTSFAPWRKSNSSSTSTGCASDNNANSAKEAAEETNTKESRGRSRSRGQPVPLTRDGYDKQLLLKPYTPRITLYDAGGGTVTVLTEAEIANNTSGSNGRTVPCPGIWGKLYRKGMKHKEDQLNAAAPTALYEERKMWSGFGKYPLHGGAAPVEPGCFRRMMPPPPPPSHYNNQQQQKSSQNDPNATGNSISTGATNSSNVFPYAGNSIFRDPWRKKAAEVLNQYIASTPSVPSTARRGRSATPTRITQAPRCAEVMCGTSREKKDKTTRSNSASQQRGDSSPSAKKGTGQKAWNFSTRPASRSFSVPTSINTSDSILFRERTRQRMRNMTAAEKEKFWAHINATLPTSRDEKDKKRREELFDRFDPNGNGLLSLAEVDRGCHHFLKLYEIFDAKSVIMRAFQVAKNAGNLQQQSQGKTIASHYIEKSEFRLFFVYLRQYFEIWQMFEEVDDSGDHRIDFSEFQKAIPMIEKWNKGNKIENPAEEFKQIDADGGGMILFDEFAHWALMKKLDIGDDGGFDDEVLHKGAHLSTKNLAKTHTSQVIKQTMKEEAEAHRKKQLEEYQRREAILKKRRELYASPIRQRREEGKEEEQQKQQESNMPNSSDDTSNKAAAEESKQTETKTTTETTAPQKTSENQKKDNKATTLPQQATSTTTTKKEETDPKDPQTAKKDEKVKKPW